MQIHLGKVSHFSFAVTDPNRSADWWLSLFNLEEYRRAPDRVVIGNDAVLLGLFSGRPDPAVLGHLAFNAGNLASLESARDSLRERGVALEDPGSEIGPVAPGSASMGLWFYDIDGYRWELYVPAPEDAHEA